MKTTITIFLLIIALSGFAQKKKNVYFFKDGNHVNSIDSANFIRMVIEPDSGSVLYNVADYYKSGKRKLVGQSSAIDPQKFQGQVATYYENGRKETIANYKDGQLVGDEYDFFSNGKPFMVKSYYIEKTSDKVLHYGFLLTASYDSLGTQQVVDGNGYFKNYNYDIDNPTFKGDSIVEEGAIKNGRREGEWKGKNNHGTFIETYANNDLVSGVFTGEKGEIARYTERLVEPAFPGGPDAFNKFLARTVKYPRYEREHNITGKIYVYFVVQKDGTLTDVKVTNPISAGFDEEGAKTVKISPPWIPGKVFGQPARVSYVVPVNFTLSVSN